MLQCRHSNIQTNWGNQLLHRQSPTTNCEASFSVREHLRHETHEDESNRACVQTTELHLPLQHALAVPACALVCQDLHPVKKQRGRLGFVSTRHLVFQLRHCPTTKQRARRRHQPCPACQCVHLLPQVMSRCIQQCHTEQCWWS